MESLNSKYKTNYSHEQSQIIENALNFAKMKHKTQLRESGEEYINHPIAVANIVMDLNLDYVTVSAALLHDVIEDTETTYEDVENIFGSDVAEIVAGVTKLSKIIFKSKKEEQAENFRKMFLAMAKDLRVIILKLADRLHNMRTISALSSERRIAFANETLEIYAPLASRLGISYIKSELEDLCFKTLNYKEFHELAEKVSLKRQQRQNIVDSFCKVLNVVLLELKIDGKVSGRPKHLYSIYKKMLRDGKTFDQIYDLTAVRVIVENINNCYEVLGKIHNIWKPIPGRFKDYIAVPKENKYQSLHTTVMTDFGMPFEIQIRTFEMHKIAEYGIAAHWKYKEDQKSVSVKKAYDEKINWLRKELENHDGVSDSTEFYELIKDELNDNMVYVFTPKGDVLRLQAGATPLDFAYAVHTEVGNKCIGAKVNGRIVPLNTTLSTGDYIEVINSASAKGPSRDWLRFVVTGVAKSKIKTFFKNEVKQDNVKKGHLIFEGEAKKQGLDLQTILNEKSVDFITKRFNFCSLSDLYAGIALGAVSAKVILQKLSEFENLLKNNTKAIKLKGFQKEEINSISINGADGIYINLAKCCSPVPGDAIVGFISHGRGIIVHRNDCINLKNLDSNRFIDAKWNNVIQESKYAVDLQIEAEDKETLVYNITQVLFENKLNVVGITKKIANNNTAIVLLTVLVSNKEQIGYIISKLLNLAEINKIFRRRAL